MSLPLVARKNLKENEVNRDAHIQRLVKHLGWTKTPTVELDTPQAFHDAASARGYENRQGEVMYDWTLGGFVNYAIKTLNDDMSKDSFKKVFTGDKIIFRLAKGSRYGTPSWDNGNLVLSIDPASLGGNVDQCGQGGAYSEGSLATILSSGDAMPLETAKNIASNQATIDKHIKTISDSLKKPVSLEYNWSEISEGMVARRYAAKQVGDVLGASLEGLANHVKKLCSDEMSQEALAEVWTNGKLIFRTKKGEGKYGTCSIEGGNLVVTVDSGSLYANVAECGKNLESIL
jgi:hypothetical protein